MQLAHPEFLLLSRTGRVMPGTSVTGRPSSRELARREMVATASRGCVRRPRRLRALGSRSGAAIAAAVAKRS
jgi:hypothetical protein